MSGSVTSRRGWREKIEAGIYKAHRLACPSSADERPGRRCACPLQINVPGVEAGKTRMMTFDGTLTDARASRRSLMAAGRPASADVGWSPTTVHELAKDWFRVGASQWSPGTHQLRNHSYRKRIAPAWGEAALTEIKRAAIEEWAARLIREGHGRRAVEIAVQTLRAMLTVALDRGLIESNPAARVKLPPAPPAERTAADRVIDRQGMERLFAACSGVGQETLLRALAEVGLRRGEAAGLTWPDVHLEQRRLVIRQSVWQSKSTGKVIRRPKAGKTGRVSITAELARLLEEWHTKSVVNGKADPSGWVWPGRGGGPMSPSSISHLAGRIGRQAGLVDSEGRHIAHAHGLRHSAGSVALSEGAPLTVVASQLRHSRPSFTASTYSHLLGDEELDRFADAHTTGTLRETLRGARKRRKKASVKPILPS